MQVILHCQRCNNALTITPEMGGQVFACPYCAQQFTAPHLVPPHQAPPPSFPLMNSAPSNSTPSNAATSAWKRPRYADEVNVGLGITAAAIWLIAFFCPVVSVPILGGISYFNIIKLQLHHGNVNAMTISVVLIIVAALLAVVFTVIKQFMAISFAAILAFVSLIITIVSFESHFGDFGGNGRNPDRIGMAVQLSISYSFGMALVFVGALVAFAAALVRIRKA